MAWHESHSVHETEAIAAILAASLHGGECIALHGDLGAGKTQFTRGLVRALEGPWKSVSSPTFVLLNVYPGSRLTVYHFDAYRVSSAEDFESIGFEELLDQKGVVVVEWAQRIATLLPPNHIAVHIRPISESSRQIEINQDASRPHKN